MFTREEAEEVINCLSSAFNNEDCENSIVSNATKKIDTLFPGIVKELECEYLIINGD